MDLFCEKDSVVRKIWGRGDAVMFIFAGASAEFALNKAVDWLYFTGKLPADPVGRLFSTLSYAKRIIFADRPSAHQAIDQINAIHSSLEQNRKKTIPDWAYRDVLYLLIYYTIASYELLQRKLGPSEKEEVYRVFYEVGTRMGLQALPVDYDGWQISHTEHLDQDLGFSPYTKDLYRQYRKHLGPLRFWVLVSAQKLLVPSRVRELLKFGKFSWLTFVLPFYKLSRKIKLDRTVRRFVLPPAYQSLVRELEVP